MSGIQVLLVAGTHGNEINAIWLFDQWSKDSDLIESSGVQVLKVIGNPKAFDNGKRYIDKDLNRSFSSDLHLSDRRSFYEYERAKELLQEFGPNGSGNCQIALDFHSTTSAMGSCLVVYGRRFSDLALASLVQNRLGLPVYLHEADEAQTGFLVEAWPCGLVIEIGAVPQGYLDPSIVYQTKNILETCLEQISQVIEGKAFYPQNLIVHRHMYSLDFPRDSNGLIDAVIHPFRNSKDWIPIEKNDPLFLKANGEEVCFMGEGKFVPVFINEASYLEKNIAMSITNREVWECKQEWMESLASLLIQS